MLPSTPNPCWVMLSPNRTIACRIRRATILLAYFLFSWAIEARSYAIRSLALQEQLCLWLLPDFRLVTLLPAILDWFRSSAASPKILLYVSCWWLHVLVVVGVTNHSGINEKA